MIKQELAFFEWWDKNESYMDQINLRMAFDAGYQAAMNVDHPNLSTKLFIDQVCEKCGEKNAN